MKKPRIELDAPDMIRQWVGQLPTIAALFYTTPDGAEDLEEAAHMAWDLLTCCRDRLEKEIELNVTKSYTTPETDHR